MTGLVCCVDFGSTYTKACLVDVDSGRLFATAVHPTTLATDVLDGWDACRARLAEAHPGVASADVRACSSAAGGLRIGVVGNEDLVTAEAARRVALSSGGRVVHVAAASSDPPGPLDATELQRLRSAAPDVLLLVGGTDGGNAEVVLACARTLADAGWRSPVVVAGNVDAQPEVAAMLAAAGVPHVRADNVVPRIGTLAPGSARAAVREMFVRHVIGGKELSARDDFVRMVRGATPDVVLDAVELLAGTAGDVVVVDIGGATTDVHSVVGVDPEDAGLSRQVVGPVPAGRTVEGDLGMRWSAVDTVRAGREAGLVAEQEVVDLDAAAQRRHADPAYLADGAREHHWDERLATVAAGVALRRHAGRQQVRFGPDGRLVERTGKDLREVDLLVGSGGVLRHRPAAAARVLGACCGHDVDGGWLLPRAPRVRVDGDYVLAAAGLLAPDHPGAARELLRGLTEQAEGVRR